MKPYYDRNGIVIYHGDARKIIPHLGEVNCVVADPPYGDTSLDWDVPISGWLPKVKLKEGGSIWCFGSLRMFMTTAAEFKDWNLAQDLIWQKPNGSSFHADRFRRVHEHVVQFYQGEWRKVYKEVVKTADAVKKTARRKLRPAHMGQIERGHFLSHDGGPRLMRSILNVPSCHGYADHPTQKPVGILGPIIEYSCPKGGVVLDPFMGAGSTLCAAKELGRLAIGIEKEKKYCEIAVRRLSQEVLFK